MRCGGNQWRGVSSLSFEFLPGPCWLVLCCLQLVLPSFPALVLRPPPPIFFPLLFVSAFLDGFCWSWREGGHLSWGQLLGIFACAQTHTLSHKHTPVLINSRMGRRDEDWRRKVKGEAWQTSQQLWLHFSLSVVFGHLFLRNWKKIGRTRLKPPTN